MNPYDRKTQRAQWTAWSAGYDAGRIADRAPTTVQIGEMIVRQRMNMGMNQKELAAAIGVSPPTVWTWENARCRPKGHRIRDLARVLNIDPSFFTTGAVQ